MALRCVRGERERLLEWAGALQRKHALPADLLEAAAARHAAACKALKKACKKSEAPSTAAEGAAHAGSAEPSPID